MENISTTNTGGCTIRSAVRFEARNKIWKASSSTETVSADVPLVVVSQDRQKHLVFGDLSDVEASTNGQRHSPIKAHRISLDEGRFDGHLVVLAHRRKHYRNIKEPYAVVCQSGLNPILLASIFQTSDHDYLHKNMDMLERSGYIIRKQWYRNTTRVDTEPWYSGSRNIVERFVERNAIAKVNSYRKVTCCYNNKRPWAELRAKYSTTSDEDLLTNHMRNMLYVTLQDRPLDTVSNGYVKRTTPFKMETSWMSGEMCYDRAGLYTFSKNPTSNETLYAFNIPGLALSPTALMFFGTNMRVVAVVIGRGLKPPTNASLMEYEISQKDVESFSISSYPFILPPENDDEYDGSDGSDGDSVTFRQAMDGEADSGSCDNCE